MGDYIPKEELAKFMASCGNTQLQQQVRHQRPQLQGSPPPWGPVAPWHCQTCSTGFGMVEHGVEHQLCRHRAAEACAECGTGAILHRHIVKRDSDEAHSAAGTAAQVEAKAAIGADNIGHKLLQKMGWKEGKGIGAREDGNAAPSRCCRCCCGAEAGYAGLGSTGPWNGPGDRRPL